MKIEKKEYILNVLSIGRDYSEDGEAEYSGRGMYGRNTHAIVIDGFSDVRDAIINLFSEMDDDERHEELDKMIDLGILYYADEDDRDTFTIEGEDDDQFSISGSIDNLGLDYIIY